MEEPSTAPSGSSISAKILGLWCWVKGDDAERVFPVEIEITASVAAAQICHQEGDVS
jgi:hypothetical protein